jgi:general secretion pathway protein A
MRISEEVKIDSAPFPLQDSDPVEIVKNPAIGVPARALTIPENVSISMAAQSYAEFEEQSAQKSTTPRDSQIAEESASERVIVAEGSEAEHIAVQQEVPIDPPALRVPATSHTMAVTDVLSFYGLPQQPFDVTPDPAYLYLTPSHREALTSLKEGIEYFRGFMMLVAEPGMGKTTILQKLMEELSDSARIVFLFQTQCSSRELLCFILNELEVDHTGMDIVGMHRALNQALLEEMLRGRRFVLIVDEAQNLQEPVLETIRLLSDFETTHSKLIQIVLAGQPQLADTLMKPSLVQLRQRIAVLSNLKSLSAAETTEYVEHRLRASGWRGEHLFTSNALAQIAESSGGVPRTINNLCFNALLAAFHRGQEIIDAETVKGVAGKLNLEPLVRRPQREADGRQTAAPAGAS